MDFGFGYALVLMLLSVTAGEIKISRKLTKAGFHRDLETTLRLPITFGNECKFSSLLIFETLPSGVYSDPFQVKSLEQFGGPEVFFGHTVDIEAAEFVSKPLELYMFVNVSSFPLHVGKDYTERTVILPIHARYHEVSDDDTHSTVTILHPGLYTDCYLGDKHSLLKAPCSNNDSNRCTWFHLSYESDSSNLAMRVPVGQESHRFLVIVGTLLITSCISVILVKVVLSHSYQEGGDKSL